MIETQRNTKKNIEKVFFFLPEKLKIQIIGGWRSWKYSNLNIMYSVHGIESHFRGKSVSNSKAIETIIDYIYF